MSGLSQEYRAGLERFLRDSSEETLSRGYELGRTALAAGLSLLELVELHRQVLVSCSEYPKELAFEFLKEALSPFEMALMGYREANTGLARANAELAEANQKIKDAQAQLVHSAKMASLGTLTAGMAHEVNNPLAFCLGHVHNIQNWLGKLHQDPALETLWQKTETRLSQVQQGLERIKELVLSLRRFSRLDESEIDTVDVHEQIELALLFLSHETRERVQIVRRYAEDGVLTCYPSLLGQVAMNLLSNAVFAIPETGTITITTTRNSEIFTIAIEDDGVGIPPENQARIYDPFFTTRPVGSGTGLGLAIAFQLVRAHRGTILLESVVGVGSRFIIELPLDFESGDAGLLLGDNNAAEGSR